MTTLPDYKPSFPTWHAKELSDNIAGCTPESAEMLAVRRRRLFLSLGIHPSIRTLTTKLGSFRVCSCTTRRSACPPRRRSSATTSSSPAASRACNQPGSPLHPPSSLFRLSIVDSLALPTTFFTIHPPFTPRSRPLSPPASVPRFFLLPRPFPSPNQSPCTLPPSFGPIPSQIFPAIRSRSRFRLTSPVGGPSI